jgi:hypothetical protein
MRQRWVARWTQDGLPYEHHFTSLSNRVIARIDFGLNIVDLGYQIPEGVELEEDSTPPERRREQWETLRPSGF